MEEHLLVVVSVLIPIITGLTQLIKETGIVYRKYYGLIPLIIGLLLGPAYIVFSPEMTVWQLLWAGGLAGLASSGFYSAQNVRNKEKDGQSRKK